MLYSSPPLGNEGIKLPVELGVIREPIAVVVVVDSSSPPPGVSVSVGWASSLLDEAEVGAADSVVLSTGGALLLLLLPSPTAAQNFSVAGRTSSV